MISHNWEPKGGWGGVLGGSWPSLWAIFSLSKQPIQLVVKTTLQSGEDPHFGSVLLPLWKILSMPLEHVFHCFSSLPFIGGTKWRQTTENRTQKITHDFLKCWPWQDLSLVPLHHLWPKLASSKLEFCRSVFQWYPDQSDWLNRAWDMLENARKFERKLWAKFLATAL